MFTATKFQSRRRIIRFCWWSRANKTLVWATKSSGIKISEKYQNKREAYIRDNSSSTIKYLFKCFSCTFIHLSSAGDVTWNQKSVFLFFLARFQREDLQSKPWKFRVFSHLRSFLTRFHPSGCRRDENEAAQDVWHSFCSLCSWKQRAASLTPSRL